MIEQDFEEELDLDMDSTMNQQDFNRSFKTNVEELKQQSAVKSQESEVECVLNSIGSPEHRQTSAISSFGERTSKSQPDIIIEEDEIDHLESQEIGGDSSEIGSGSPKVGSGQSSGSQADQSESNSPPDPNQTASNSPTEEDLKLTNEKFNLPYYAINYLKEKNIISLFEWQYKCLQCNGVLEGKRNLVFSAPTSAGKSIVPDILLYNQLSNRRKKVLIVLPYVALSLEKLNHLTSMFKYGSFTIGGFMANALPSGGFPAMDIAICTIERANNIINNLVQENKLHELGTIVVDEAHEIGTSDRGTLIEQMLTKIMYSKKQNPAIDVQIIAMSATLPNLKDLATWLDAEMYETDFRPIPLSEMIKIGEEIRRVPDLALIRHVSEISFRLRNDSSNLLSLTLETILTGHGVLVFCGSKKDCETFAEHMYQQIERIVSFNPDNTKIPEATKKLALNAKSFLVSEVLKQNGAFQAEILEQLARQSASQTELLKRTLPFAVAYHHSSLSSDERDIIETGFKEGHIKVIFCTPTLASGVNLPGK